jgi:predicted SprT family Zn-dependent metalloprotease
LAEIERAYQIVEAKYGQSIPRVPVTFSNKLTKSGGNAGYTRNRATGTLTPTGIELSLPLLRLNGETFVMDTPAHEAMHIATFALFDYAGHGPHWKNLMRLVGRSTSRCHQMETVKKRGVAATCGCKTHEITKVRANKMRRGAVYTCTLCRTPLKLGGRIAPAPSKMVVREVPHVPTKATAPVAAPRSKAEVVKAAIKLFKQAGTALDQVLESNKVVQEIAAEAGLTAALCRTYLKNNWRKV